MAADMTYTHIERNRAAAWKRVTDTLPADAQVLSPYIGKDGRAGRVPYDFCLPAVFAELSLPPEVRRAALELFDELEIRGMPVSMAARPTICSRRRCSA